MTAPTGTDLIVQEIDSLSALYAIRDVHAEKLKSTEAQIALMERGILAAMNAAGISTIGSAATVAVIKIERVYKGEDWTRLYERIRMTGEFDLLHRRLSTTAVRERENAGDLPQGVTVVTLQKLKLERA